MRKTTERMSEAEKKNEYNRMELLVECEAVRDRLMDENQQLRTDALRLTRENLVLSTDLAAMTERADKAEAEILRRDSFYGVDGCSTGDCPHDTVQECSDAQADLIREQEAKIAKLYQERDKAIKLANAWHEYADCQSDLACGMPEEDTLNRRERAKQVIHECGSDEDSQAPRSYSEIQTRCDELEKALRSCKGNASVLIESEACPGCTAVCITVDAALSTLTPPTAAATQEPGEGVEK